MRTTLAAFASVLVAACTVGAATVTAGAGTTGWSAPRTAAFAPRPGTGAVSLVFAGRTGVGVSLVQDANSILSPWRLVPVGGRIADLGRVPLDQVSGLAGGATWQGDVGAQAGETYLLAIAAGGEVRFEMTALNTLVAPPTGRVIYQVGGTGVSGGGGAGQPGGGGVSSGGTCTPLAAGAALARPQPGAGRLLVEARGLAGGTLIGVDPATGRIQSSTTYAVDEVVLLDPKTGESHLFPYIADEYPRLSPDGWSAVLRNFGWEVVRPGASAHTYHGHLADVAWTAAAWSPDGRYLAYQGAGVHADNFVSFSGMLYVLDLATGQECLASPDGGVENVGWLAHDRLVFSTATALYEMNASMHGYLRLPVRTGGIVGGAFSLSPDGRWVAWSRQGAGTEDVWLAAVHGGGEWQMTRDTAADLTPTFSPDGRQIAFVRMSGAFPGQLWVMDANGKAAAPLTTPGGALIGGVVAVDQWLSGTTADRWPERG